MYKLNDKLVKNALLESLIYFIATDVQFNRNVNGD